MGNKEQEQQTHGRPERRERQRHFQDGLPNELLGNPKILQSILDSVADGLIVTDRKGKFLILNAAAESITGLDSVDIAPSEWSGTFGCYLPDAVTPYPSDQLPLARALRGEAVREAEIFLRNDKHPDGLWLSMNGIPWRDETGAVCGGVVLFRDVTRQKKSGELFRHLSSAVEQTAESVIITDSHGKMIYVNPAFEQTTGYSKQEALGQTPRLLKSGEHDQTFYSELWATLQAGKVYRGTLINRRKNGETFHAEQTITPIRDAAGKHSQYVSVMKDVSERRRQETLEVELQLARQVQQRLYPQSAPDLAGFDIAGAACPAESLCGDYFDYFSMPHGCLGIAIGDVSGHGFGASLVMEETRAYLRSFAYTNSDVSQILNWVNEALASDLTQERFVTLLLARLDPRERCLVYANAGHVHGYVLDSRGAVKAELESTGIPLGFFKERRCFTGQTIALDASDILVLLTDGIAEHVGPSGNDFGVERTLEFIKAHRHATANEIVEGLFRAVRDFAQDSPQLDDMTAVICKVEASS